MIQDPVQEIIHTILWITLETAKPLKWQIPFSLFPILSSLAFCWRVLAELGYAAIKLGHLSAAIEGLESGRYSNGFAQGGHLWPMLEPFDDGQTSVIRPGRPCARWRAVPRLHLSPH
jgi:hypothetical protein